MYRSFSNIKMSSPSKKHLNSLLQLFEESCFHLQSSISDFEMQIKTKAKECLDNTSGTTMTVKEAIVKVTTAQNTILEHSDMLNESNKSYPPEMKTSAENKMKDQDYEINEVNPNLLIRLEHIETTLAALQDTNQKTEDDIAELKQWRDNSVSEQNDAALKIEKTSKKQKQNFKNMRKQLNEQDSKIEEIIKENKNFEERESSSNKTLEKLSLDIKEQEKNLQKLNENMQVISDNFTQEIKQRTDLINDFQEDKKNIQTTQNKLDNLISKQAVMSKILHQRLSPIDQLLQMCNQKSGSREEKLTRIDVLEKSVIKLSGDFHTLANQQVKHSTVGFVASGRPVVVTELSGVFKRLSYTNVEHNKGNEFKPNIGLFTAPVTGMYIVSLRINNIRDETAKVWINHKSGNIISEPVNIDTNEDLYVASSTTVLLMKTGDEMFSCSYDNRFDCTHFSCFLLGI